MGVETYCVRCGRLWGDETGFGSSGICPTCFGEWANNKRKFQNQEECYGAYKLYADNNCDECFVSNLCKKDSM